MKKFAHHTLSFSMNECWIFFDLAVRDSKVEMIDWNQYVSCTLKHCQLSWQQMVQCPVLAECWGAKRCWMLNVETWHCLPTCYWQVLWWWRRTGHNVLNTHHQTLSIGARCLFGEKRKMKIQILLSTVGNTTYCNTIEPSWYILISPIIICL